MINRKLSLNGRLQRLERKVGMTESFSDKWVTKSKDLEKAIDHARSSFAKFQYLECKEVNLKINPKWKFIPGQIASGFPWKDGEIAAQLNVFPIKGLFYPYNSNGIYLMEDPRTGVMFSSDREIEDYFRYLERSGLMMSKRQFEKYRLEYKKRKDVINQEKAEKEKEKRELQLQKELKFGSSPIANQKLSKYLRKVDKICDRTFSNDPEDENNIGNLDAEEFLDILNSELELEDQIYYLRKFEIRFIKDSFEKGSFYVFNFELSDQRSYGKAFLCKSFSEFENLLNSDLLKEEYIAFQEV